MVEITRKEAEYIKSMCNYVQKNGLTHISNLYNSIGTNKKLQNVLSGWIEETVIEHDEIQTIKAKMEQILYE